MVNGHRYRLLPCLSLRRRGLFIESGLALKRKHQEGGEVQEIEIIAHLTEPGTRSRNAQELHRTESVRQMNCNHGDQQNHSHRDDRPDQQSSKQ